MRETADLLALLRMNSHLCSAHFNARVSHVRYVVLIVIAVCFAVLQYGWLAHWITGPDLLIALAAWIMVDGTEDGVLMRAWVVGLVADMIDPGSECFHSLMFLGLALAYLPVRSLVFRSRMTGWGAWAMICSLLSNLIDGWIGGFGDATGRTMLLSSLWTAAAAVAIGWLFRGLPAKLQPVGKGGA